MRAFVIGSPVSHSLSPAIFTYISQKLRRQVPYEAREVRPEHGHDFIASMKGDRNLLGMNVTLPLKELVISDMDSVSDAVQSIGAMNVIQLKEGKALGHNTDVIGIQKTLERAEFKFEGASVLLWGAGGSAKAVAFILGKLNAKKVYIFNRGPRGHELAQKYGDLFPETTFLSIDSLGLVSDELSLMVNTTPLGMQGQESGSSYFEQASVLKFSPGALAFDLIYVPLKTDFLQVAEKLGLKTVSGLGMLIDQAIATWELWIGPVPNWNELYSGLERFLKGMLRVRRETRPIFLTGFMGAGKTTVGKRLSEMTKKEFIDSDHYVEAKTGLSVQEIFQQKGEDEFRRLETEALKELSQKCDVIVSLGGGALKSLENQSTIKASGTLIYLKATAHVLYDRIEKDGPVRPLLQGLRGEEKLKKISVLLGERESLYESAHHQVCTDGKDPTDVSVEIISVLGESA